MNYWTYATREGAFSIVERSSRGVDVYFGQSLVGHFRSPVEAAEAVGNGNHQALSCVPDNGKSLGVPTAVHDWTFVHANKSRAVRR